MSMDQDTKDFWRRESQRRTMAPRQSRWVFGWEWDDSIVPPGATNKVQRLGEELSAEEAYKMVAYHPAGHGRLVRRIVSAWEEVG